MSHAAPGLTQVIGGWPGMQTESCSNLLRPGDHRDLRANNGSIVYCVNWEHATLRDEDHGG